MPKLLKALFLVIYDRENKKIIKKEKNLRI